MRILITAGPTREHIDPVRFITNASSGRMGLAVAAAAAGAGHQVTLLHAAGMDVRGAGEDVERAAFVSVADLKRLLHERFAECDALVMAAAVGDFQVENYSPQKIPRRGGPIALRLVPTEDLLAGVAAGRREGQRIIAFAVEDGPREQVEAKARDELRSKGADYVVVNRPEAMAAEASEACILSPGGIVLPWGHRPKEELAREIIGFLGSK